MRKRLVQTGRYDRKISSNCGTHDLFRARRHPLMAKLHGIKSSNPLVAQMIAEQVFDNALVAAGLMDDSRVMLPRWTSLRKVASGISVEVSVDGEQRRGRGLLFLNLLVVKYMEILMGVKGEVGLFPVLIIAWLVCVFLSSQNDRLLFSMFHNLGVQYRTMSCFVSLVALWLDMLLLVYFVPYPTIFSPLTWPCWSRWMYCRCRLNELMAKVLTGVSPDVTGSSNDGASTNESEATEKSPWRELCFGVGCQVFPLEEIGLILFEDIFIHLKAYHVY